MQYLNKKNLNSLAQYIVIYSALVIYIYSNPALLASKFLVGSETATAVVREDNKLMFNKLLY